MRKACCRLVSVSSWPSLQRLGVDDDEKPPPVSLGCASIELRMWPEEQCQNRNPTCNVALQLQLASSVPQPCGWSTLRGSLTSLMCVATTASSHTASRVLCVAAHRIYSVGYVQIRPFHTEHEPNSTQHTTCEPRVLRSWVTNTHHMLLFCCTRVLQRCAGPGALRGLPTLYMCRKHRLPTSHPKP